MKTLVILNHELSQEQLAELGEVTTLTPDQKKLWSQIPAMGDSHDVARHIAPITHLIIYHDRVVCQGEFTAFAEVVSWCRALRRPLLVACSRRETVEEVQPDGSVKKTAVFRHVQFREVRPF